MPSSTNRPRTPAIAILSRRRRRCLFDRGGLPLRPPGPSPGGRLRGGGLPPPPAPPVPPDAPPDPPRSAEVRPRPAGAPRRGAGGGPRPPELPPAPRPRAPARGGGGPPGAGGGAGGGGGGGPPPPGAPAGAAACGTTAAAGAAGAGRWWPADRAGARGDRGGLVVGRHVAAPLGQSWTRTGITPRAGWRLLLAITGTTRENSTRCA